MLAVDQNMNTFLHVEAIKQQTKVNTMKTANTETFNEYTPAPLKGLNFTCNSEQQREIAKYQQGGISFVKSGRNKWTVTFRFHPHDGDAMSLNATASTICGIAGLEKPEGVTQDYCKRVLLFFKTGF
jgi:hypothetical protein